MLVSTGKVSTYRISGKLHHGVQLKKSILHSHCGGRPHCPLALARAGWTSQFRIHFHCSTAPSHPTPQEISNTTRICKRRLNSSDFPEGSCEGNGHLPWITVSWLAPRACSKEHMSTSSSTAREAHFFCCGNRVKKSSSLVCLLTGVLLSSSNGYVLHNPIVGLVG